MSKKFIIQRGTFSKPLTTKRAKAAVKEIKENNEEYVEIEVSNFTWFAANHYILWMSLMTFPVAAGAIYCVYKHVENEEAWFMGLLLLFVVNTVISFTIATNAFDKVFGDET